MSGLVKSRKDWAALIAAAWNKSRQSIIETGRELTAAKNELAHGEYEAMVESDLPFGARTAQRLTAIAADLRISNTTHGSFMPASWRTLYDLTRLTDEQFSEGLERNIIRPDMERKDLNAWRNNERRSEAAARIGEAAKLEGKYPIIYADPPWRYENPPMGASNRSIENHYPTLSLEEICALPVSDIATDDSLLFLWATAPKLAECFEVVEAWGFNYRTNLVWIKEQLGMGYYARNKHELLLIAKRGSPPMPQESDRPSSVFQSARTKHSTKPPAFYEAIERMYPSFPKIELFCRTPRENWAAWGNEVEPT